VHPTEVNRLRNEIRRLLLAEKDMEMVAEAAQVLADEDYAPCRRVIETGPRGHLLPTVQRPSESACE
jgi:hypothetical protein